MEALTCLLRRANEGGLLTSFKANNRDGEGLEAISSLKINLTKSKLIPIGRVEDLEDLAFEIGCKVGVLPTAYLGLPLGTHNNSLAVWDEMKERFNKRLEKGGSRSKAPSFAQQGSPLRLNDREIDIVQCFLTRLQDKVVVEGGQGKVC
ncbi:hypothetical protein CK203_017139 [Vitis vinifera]|uniref:Uncharacterized protein n=1 Tax=Vitis vinifera TaxID=29760 RepID=A0A438JZT3_VITVI|nr:hypothetical protein CK203_017139 [Vitis vinifera]